MTLVWLKQFVLFLLILHHISSEQPEPVFRAKDSNVEIGYCFGADYIVVYRSTLEGDQLLGNSSDRNIPDAVPADLQGRTRITEEHNLLGLQIVNITHRESGMYRRECWENQTRRSQHTYQLTVCNQEIESEEIVAEEDGGAKLLCNSTFLGLEGTSIRWYHEIYPNYKLTLFLDSSVSLKPLVKELPGVVEVRDQGARLVIDNRVIKNNQQFYCLIFNGTNCLSFQNMYPPDNSDSSEMFVSRGDEVVLYCPVDGDNQQWDTPLGKITGSNVNSQQMYVSSPSDFSLVIPVVSDEHTGDYSCLSSTLDVQYLLVLCSEKQYEEKLARESGTVSVKCNLDQNSSLSIKWERGERSGQDELIYDSGDESVVIPVDLRGRLTLSEDASMLTISDLKRTDGGAYWCVVLKTPPMVEGDGDYDYEYEDDEEDPDSDTDYSSHMQSCLSKQVTVLTVTVTQPVTSPSLPVSSASVPTEPSDNVAAIAVAIVVVVLLVIGAIIGGIVVMKRRNASAEQRQAAPQSGQLLKTEVELQKDPGCNDRLTSHDDVP